MAQISTTQPQESSGAYTADTYQRRDAHKARTSHEDETSYILTLHTDASHHKQMTALRKKYFPPKLNKLEAHIALFRALPGSELPRIMDDIAEIASSTQQFQIDADQPFQMGHGVGIRVSRAEPARGVFEELKGRWEGFLSQQDRSFKAHYTIQNKVDDEAVVQKTLKEVSEGFEGSRGVVNGLNLYRFERGVWKKERDFPFGGAKKT